VLEHDARIKRDRTWHWSGKYRHHGPEWKFDGGGFHSHSTNSYRDKDYGFFSGVTNRVRNLTMRYDAINTVRRGRAWSLATTTAGAPVNLHSLNSYSYTVATAESNQRSSSDTVMGAHLNARRDFAVPAAIGLRAGLDVRRMERDIRTLNPIWTFVGPTVSPPPPTISGGATISSTTSTPRPTPPSISPRSSGPVRTSCGSLYQVHPEYFRLEEAGFISSTAGNSRRLIETVSSAYLCARTCASSTAGCWSPPARGMNARRTRAGPA
jgi:hypothetical protein